MKKYWIKTEHGWNLSIHVGAFSFDITYINKAGRDKIKDLKKNLKGMIGSIDDLLATMDNVGDTPHIHGKDCNLPIA